MRRKHRVLWIEDGANAEMALAAGPVYSDGHYDLIIAPDVSEGIRYLQDNEFDAVVVDIRLVPGNRKNWIDLNKEFGSDKVQARLGIHLLYSFLRPETAKVKLKNVPRWVRPERFGVLSVEPQAQIDADLKALGVTAYAEKNTAKDKNVLKDIIVKILAQHGGRL